MLAVLALGAGMLCGCGGKVDENKTPEQIQKEVGSMSSSRIQSQIDAYSKEIEKRSAELQVEADKLAKIPLMQQFGDEAKNIKSRMSDITKSIDKLKANLEAYSDGLKAKK